jgi:hypothetical protein
VPAVEPGKRQGFMPVIRQVPGAAKNFLPPAGFADRWGSPHLAACRPATAMRNAAANHLARDAQSHYLIEKY